MSKIKYDFSGINSTLTQINNSVNEFATVKGYVSALAIDCPDVSAELEAAKKSTIDNITNAEEKYLDNIKFARDVCSEYQEYEAKAPSSEEFLGTNFTIKNLPANSGSVTQHSYTIKSGDTLSEIAKSNNTTVDAILQSNPGLIKDKNLIFSGQSIVIPTAGVAMATGMVTQTSSSGNETTVTSNTPYFTASTSSNSDSSNDTSSGSNTSSVNNYSSNSKYKSKPEAGFNVTTGNQTYQLSDKDLDFFMAVVASEADNGSVDDCLAVASVVLNRCEAKSEWFYRAFGDNPIDQLKASGQFSGYLEGHYSKFLDGNVNENVRIAVTDALNGVRNNDYLAFKANYVTSVGNNMISANGNRYHA